MKLHLNRRLSDELVEETAEYFKLDVDMIVKDYHIVFILKELIKRYPEIIFKGGTSLSKIWHVINRFSEDIDLTASKNPVETKRRKLSHAIKEIISSNNYKLIDEEQIWSKKVYNKYLIAYPHDENQKLNANIVIETAFYVDSFPHVKKEISTYIYDYLKAMGDEEIIKEYELEPFEINVQTLERTFIDKVFALCDYSIRGSINRRARHIYDLYKLFPHIEFNDEFKDLIAKTRIARSENEKCVSVIENRSINKLLKEIMDKETFKSDYNLNTKMMFMYDENVPYEEAITVLDKIIQMGIFE